MKLIITMFQSLDGVTQAPGSPDEDRSDGFEQGGWMFPFSDPDFQGQVVKSMSAAGGFLLGRKTYEIFAAHWPRITDKKDPIASRLNSLPKYVVSSTLTKAEWNNTTVIKTNVVDEVARLKRTAGNELQVSGSSRLVQTLIAGDLVDEYRLWVFPIILGQGKRIFGSGAVPAALRLVEIQKCASGVVFQTYQRAGKMVYAAAPAPK